MKKRLMSLLLVCSMILSLFTGLSVTALAVDVDPATATPTPTDASAFEFSNGKITGYTGSDANVVIPASIDGTPVTSIGQAAFMSKGGIETVVIPSTVTYIAAYVFDYCSDLTDVYFYGSAPTFDSYFIDDDSLSINIHCKSANITVTVTPEEGGTAVASAASVESGKSCTVTITPAEGYELDTVTDNGDDVTSSVTDGEYTIKNVTAAHDIVVTFKESTVTPSEPDGSAAYPYEIGTAAELIALSDKVYGGDKCENVYYVLTDDIVLDSSTTFRPIGTSSSKYFSGVFDGQNHTISGLNVSYYDYSGVFGSVKKATIKNLTVKGSVKGGSKTGGVVGCAIASTLSNLHNEAGVTGKDTSANYIGGVVGYIGSDAYVSAGTTVTNCTNSGDVSVQCSSTTAAFGGIVGYAHGTSSVTNTVSDCTNSGDVTSSGRQGKIGGIVGGFATSSKLKITNCWNSGTLTKPASGSADDVLGETNDTNATISNSGKKETTYTITVNVTPTAGGTAVAAPASVESGKSSTITITPNDGYELASLKVGTEDMTAKVTNNTYTISNITANTTVTVTFKEKTQTVDYFQKFFETKTNMTAEKISGWTSANGKTIKASGTANSVFKLTVKEDGYLAVYGTVDGTLAKVNAVNQKSEAVGVLTTTNMQATQTAFAKQVNKGDVITFTYTNTSVNGTDNYVEITSITLTENCPHTVHPFTEKTDATCTTDGNVAYYKCLTCNKYFSDPTCKNELTEVILPAHHTYDESKDVSVDDGKATVRTCSKCGLTTVIAASSGTSETTYTVTLTGSNVTFTAEGKTGTSYAVGIGKDLYFLAKAASGYVITNVTNAAAVEGYDGLYKIANVTGNKTVTLTTAEAPKSEYSFEVRTNEDGTKVAYITGYKGNGGAITLPKEYDDGTTKYNVVGVAERAFCGTGSTANTSTDSLAEITSITVPTGIKYIEAMAFCSVGRYSPKSYKLTTITFQDPDTVFVANRSSQNSQLSSNPNLTTVTLPANLTEIPSSLFMNDTKLDNVTIPKGVTKIGKDAFKGCTGLKTATMKSGMAPTVEAGDRPNNNYPFAGCTVTVSIPKGTLQSYQTTWDKMLNATDKTKAGNITLKEQGGGIVSLADFIVDDITYKVISLQDMTVEVKYVGKNGSGTLTIPKTVMTTKDGDDLSFTVIGIGEKAMDFNGYKQSQYISSSYGFTKVEFPDTLTYLEKWSCAGLNKVTEIDLSNTKVKTIGSFAFNNCESLVTIKLPATLVSFGGETKTEKKENEDQSGNDTNTGYDGGSESNKKFDEKQEESVSYTENVFMGCQSLQNIFVAAENPNFKDEDGVIFTKDGKTLIRYPVGKPETTYNIPEGTQTIADGAFMQIAGNQANGALKSVSFPRSLKEIKSGAFRQSSLTSVELPANVTFGSYIFDCSKSLTIVTTESGVTEIPAKAFWGCENLTSVTLADSVKAIGESAFERAGFTEINLNKVTKIGKYAFYFSKLKSITVPAAAECDTGAFMNCPDLTTATVNGTKLGKYMFWYCTGLTSLTANNVTEIDEGALGYCVKLTSLPLDKVTSIGHGAFRNCHALTTVTIPSSVQSFGKYVFADCGNLSSVTFAGNASVTSLPEGTFYECLNLREVHLGDYISQTEGLSLYMAGWNNGLTVNVYCNQPEEYFFRNEFDTCFIDLGNQQLDSENKEKTDITYIWTSTTHKADGTPVYHFRAEAGGGCGGGCGGGTGAEGEDGKTEYTMEPSVNAVFHYAAADNGAALENLTSARASALYSALPTVLTVEIHDKSGKLVETKYYTLPDLESMAQTTPAGYQYVGMKGWAVMAATEYVTIDDLIGGEPLTGTDSITLYAGDGATYSVTGADLQQNSYFFPDSNSCTNNKVTSPATPVPAIIALEWNTGKIEQRLTAARSTRSPERPTSPRTSASPTA